MVNPISQSWTAGYMEPRGYMENYLRNGKPFQIFKVTFEYGDPYG
jgi:hypothetical protein